MESEVQLKHRPKSLGQVVGQPEAVAMLRAKIEKNKVPHAILFSGPAGTGKTSLARILTRKLNCNEQTCCEEINCAKDGSIDMVRRIGQTIQFRPMGGSARVWILDEFQSLSRAGFAQQSMLKILEEPGPYDWFFLCATDTDKIIPAIKTRCTHVALKPLAPSDVRNLLEDVAKKEGIKLSAEVRDAIIDKACGSAREALVLLNQIADVPGEKERIAVIGMGEHGRKQAIDLCRLFMKPKVSWAEVAGLIKEIEDDPEQVRRAIRGYCSSVVIGGGPQANRAAAILSTCYDLWHDKASLVEACWVIFGKK